MNNINISIENLLKLRVKLAELPTPLQYMKNLTNFLNGPQLYIKRDDLTGLAVGGNKLRKLEFFIGDAIQKNADLIITSGQLHSNWLPQAAASARKFGLDILIVCEKERNEFVQGNLLLDKIFGANFVFISKEDLFNNANKIMYEIAKSYKKKGKNPYIIERDGTKIIGNLGYVLAAKEILNQAAIKKIRIDYVILPIASCETFSGIISGFRGYGSNLKMIGITPRRLKEDCIFKVVQINEAISKHLGSNFKIKKSDFCINDEYLFNKEDNKIKEVIEAIKLIAQKEGILLDPIYTGRAMAALLRLIKKGSLNLGQNIVFYHTGGIGEIFSNNEYFM